MRKAPLLLVVVLTVAASTGCSTARQKAAPTSTARPATPTSIQSTESEMAAELFWQEDFGRFQEELGQGSTGDEPFVPGQLSPAFIVREIRAGNGDIESSMLDAAESLMNCGDKLKALGSPPHGTDYDSNLRDFRAYQEACRSYEAAGKLFWRGIGQRNVVLLKAAYPFVRDGDKVLCAAGIGAFSCRGRAGKS